MIIGLGGSVPAFQNKLKKWDGFPYLSDEDIKNDLEILKQKISDMD